MQGENLEPLMPFLLCDALYDIYNRDIAHLDLKHREQKLRSDWDRHYTMFNRPFFAAIGVENYDQITDLMDDFEQFIGNNVMILRSELMLLIQDVPFEKRGIIVSSLLCHVLAQAAQCSYGNVYRKKKVLAKDFHGRVMYVHSPEKNVHLEAISKDSYSLANSWHSAISAALLDPNKTKGIPSAVNALCRKIYRWLEEN